MYKLKKAYPVFDALYACGCVDFDKEYTVGEFIEEAVKKQPDVSVRFRINGTSFDAHYAKGELSGKVFPERIINARIADVFFYVAWDRGDYVLFLN